MIPRLSIFILFVVVTCHVYSQEKDTTSVKVPVVPYPQTDTTPKITHTDVSGTSQHPDYVDPEKDYSYNQNHFQVFPQSDFRPKKGLLQTPYLHLLIPAAMITYGIVSRNNASLQELDHSTNNEVKEHLKVKIPIDNYSQFAPAVAVLGLRLAGVDAKHNFRDQAIVMATSYMLMGAAVQTMKTSVHVWRPDGSNEKSFPSGHTATAFVGAHILFKEYQDVSPWIGVGGYAIAAGTGALRVLNKKHWISDVVTGAGIGILSVEAGYRLLPVFHNLFGIKDANKNLVITPVVSSNSYGVGFAYTF